MKQFPHITSIVPRLPPAVNGLGDYGLNLARQLLQSFDLVTEFIVGTPDAPRLDSVEGFAVKQVQERSVNALLDVLPSNSQSPTTVLLHYVGYGYARRGCPVWLVEGLERWLKSGNNRRLVTMFHEIYAFGPIWTSQFWTSPLQRNLATRLIRTSSRCLTSNQSFAAIISKFGQGKQSTIPVLPVFSNVGDSEHLPALAERPRRLVVFGGGGPRSSVYQKSRLALEQTCHSLEIEEIVDVGPELGFEIEPVDGIPIMSLGVKPAGEVSSLLSTSMVGFFSYYSELMAKSTSFASYYAHRLIPVVVVPKEIDLDGLEAGKHYWLASRHQDIMSLAAGQAIADNAYAWYQTHNLSVQAAIFANCLIFD